MVEITQASAETPIEQVLERLEALVLEELEPHASLPSEGELAQRFGVSRLTVREAVKILKGRGLVTVSQGRRPTVTEPSGAIIGSYFSAMLRRDPSSLLDLLEVRQAVEVHAAGLAARRGSRSVVAALAATLNEMRAAKGPEDFHDADGRYHDVLALASGNRMLIFVLEALQAPLRESFIKSYEGHLLRGGGFEEVLDSHQAIIDHVRDRDEQGAAKAMQAHLKQVELDLKTALRRSTEHSAKGRAVADDGGV